MPQKRRNSKGNSRPSWGRTETPCQKNKHPGVGWTEKEKKTELLKIRKERSMPEFSPVRSGGGGEGPSPDKGHGTTEKKKRREGVGRKTSEPPHHGRDQKKGRNVETKGVRATKTNGVEGKGTEKPREGGSKTICVHSLQKKIGPVPAY